MSGILGVHVGKISRVLDPPYKNRNTMHEAIRVDCEILGLNAAQIFTHGPRGHRRNEMDYGKVKKLAKEIHISVHSSYPSVAIWKVTRQNINDKVSLIILAHIKDQLYSCQKIDSDGLVLHLPRRPLEEIIETMKAIEPILQEIKIPIWLEMISSCAHPELTYESPEKINKLVKALKDIDPSVWGLCIDTAHIYGSGLDISTKEQQDEWFDGLSKEATKKIKMFHLNGTESKLGSGTDKHAICFCPTDNIYKKFKKTPKKSGVYSIIKFCQKKFIPVILEINRGTEKSVVQLINIISDMEKSESKSSDLKKKQ